MDPIEAAGMAATAGARRGLGRRRGADPEAGDAGRRGRRGRPDSRPDAAAPAGDTRSDSRLAQAWPYAPPDQRPDARRDGRLADAWPYENVGEDRAGSRRDSGLADSWPRTGDDRPRTESGRRLGRRHAKQSGGSDKASADPLTGAWPYSERDLDPASNRDYLGTARPGRSADAGEPEQGRGKRRFGAGRSSSSRSPSGQSPSGQPPAGDWPYADLDAQPRRDLGSDAGRTRSGRSAAGTWPYSDSGDFAGRDRRDPYASDPYSQDIYERGRERGGGEREPDRGRSRGTRRRKINEPTSPSGQRPYDEPRASRDSGAHRRDWEPGSSWDRDSGVRSGPSRNSGPTPRVRGTADPYGTDWSRGRDDSYASGRSQPQQESSGGKSAGRGRRRFGRRRGDDQPADRDRNDRQSRGASSAWSGGGDELEPLPQPDGQDYRGGRRRSWQPSDDRDWGRYGDAGNPDPRRADPLSDFEPEYEGDSW
ncbi:MAG: hypothetical protein LBV34_11310 [Nocardiopsaceae bacterium]|nr:hypothetical protein [Nocardiopsaceae bacterium]